MIYKILRPSEWEEFDSSGVFEGSPDDKRDGFIHCSSFEQVSATAMRIFGDEPALVILAIAAEPVADSLRWEASTGGEAFPHIYRSLPREAVVKVFHAPGAGEVGSVVTPPR